ncbi:MAG: undecaprenyldiphospho-muramoylpentapeptide beta-N-acetylglucosaminyltransferase [Spirochaetaceae bacterium]
MTKFIAFTGGGTGGHVIPGLAVMEALREKYPGELFWIGSKHGIERSIISRSAPDCRYYAIPAGKLRRYLSIRNAFDVFRVLAGVVVSFVIFLRVRPEVLFSKGGYVSVPPVFAAWLLRIPVVTHESDADPGLATRINARFADRICVPYSTTRSQFPESLRERVTVTGNPVRRDLAGVDAANLRQRFGFEADKPLVFVFGGSLGSERLNSAVDEVLDRLLEHACVVHQRGGASAEWRTRPGYVAQQFFYEDYPEILAAADLAVCRAGAGTLWELAASRTPAVCVPLSLSASRGDQIRNAKVFEGYGTVSVLQEETLEPDLLLREILRILRDSDRRNAMIGACATVSMQAADELISDMILAIRK